MKRFWRVVLSRTFLLGLLAVVQIGVFTAVFFELNRLNTVIYTMITIVAVIVAVAVFERDNLNPAYKMMWLLLIVLLPVSGVIYYLCFGRHRSSQKALKQLSEIEHRSVASMPPDVSTLSSSPPFDPDLQRCVDYLSITAAAPLYGDTRSEYFSMGQTFFLRFLEEIQKAQKYIFMEYFIIDDESHMWRQTLEILKEKAAAGVDVRVLYDSFGCIATLPSGYDAQLRAAGIRCYAFNDMHFSLHISDYKMFNHRDHRKITIVDGEVGFSSGLNFADEYINEKKRFGIWKDTGFCIQGPAVYTLTAMFLKMWDFMTGGETHLADYRPKGRFLGDGYVQPYGDSPLDEENVAESSYFNILNRAQQYVYMVSPYLIVDNEMLTSLCLTAKSGIDVRIITPGIPDKWYVYHATQSYYAQLLRAGVRIYEYTPGFIHAKMHLSDDKIAIVGSANMDYRSLYLHFENCCVFYHGGIVQDIKRDFTATLAESREVLLSDIAQLPLYRRALQIFFRFFAPMM
ncbi:MAG: cardiolipin synthase [Ruthenibacterium sp.]